MEGKKSANVDAQWDRRVRGVELLQMQWYDGMINSLLVATGKSIYIRQYRGQGRRLTELRWVVA